MKNFLIFYFLLFLAFSAVSDKVETLTIVHTNDLHAYLQPDSGRAGFARIAAFFKKIRKEKKNVIILDAGDCITGTPVSAIYKGTPVFEIMAKMGCDAQALGNHEFDWGYKKIEEYKKIAPYPILCANAYTPDGRLIADMPYKIFDINGIKVAVIGLISEKTSEYTQKEDNKGVSFLSEIETAEKLVAKLKKKCDFLIMLTHIGLKSDKRLASAVKGISLIVGGHSHSLLKKPFVIGDTYIVQAGCYGRYVGVATAQINMDTHKAIDVSYKILRPSNLPPPDASVKKLVEKWEKKVSKQVDKRIGFATHTFSDSEMKSFIEKIISEKTNSDFGFYNHGGIRDRIYKGPIEARRIWNIEPFGNIIAIATIKGKNIGGVLLRSLRKRKFNIEPYKNYTIATNNFVIERSRKFIGVPAKTQKTDISVRDTIIDYIKNSKKDHSDPAIF